MVFATGFKDAMSRVVVVGLKPSMGGRRGGGVGR
jgi:hypothetical protein